MKQTLFLIGIILLLLFLLVKAEQRAAVSSYKVAQEVVKHDRMAIVQRKMYKDQEKLLAKGKEDEKRIARLQHLVDSGAVRLYIGGEGARTADANGRPFPYGRAIELTGNARLAYFELLRGIKHNERQVRGLQNYVKNILQL